MSASLEALAARVERADSATVLAGCGDCYTAAGLLGQVELAAGRLERAGVRRLAVCADNSPDWVVVDLAARRARIPVVPIPPFFSADQIRHVLADSGVDAIAADEPGSVPLVSLATLFAGELTPRLALLSLDGVGHRRGLFPGTAKISYTSGTTGAPKGVCLSQDALDRVALGLADATRDIGIARHLCLLPLATLLENIAGVYTPLIAEAEVTVPALGETGLLGASGLDLACLLECLWAYEPESVILLPQLLAGLVGAVERGARLPRSLRFAAVGGGVVGVPLLERADRVGIPVYEGYGLTECASVVALNTPKARRMGSVGRPLPHCRVRIDERSEVFVDGAAMSGYLGHGASRVGEVATGDIGHFDADGFLFISGRKKNVMISSYGRNVSPEWVEASLTAAGPIAQAALFGDGKPFNVAVIVPAPGASSEDVERGVEDANGTLPDYARVRCWIRAAEPFSPAKQTLTTNGRLRRDVIERVYRPQLDACYARETEAYA